MVLSRDCASAVQLVVKIADTPEDGSGSWYNSIVLEDHESKK